jgi:NAD-dependent dihydropyrimidine dehydrogenase PreA subunit
MSYIITEKCKGCGSCAKVCPTAAISGEKKAQHLIDKNKCIECGVCGRICPTAETVLDAKGNYCEKVKKSEWPKPIVIRSICSACGICIDMCPFDCLDLTEPEEFPRTIKSSARLIDEKACVGCSICSNACPQEAIYLARTL